MFSDLRCDGISIEIGGSASCCEDCSKKEVAVASREVTKNCNAVVEAENRLGNMAMVLEEFGMDSDVPDLFELVFLVELMIVSVDSTTEGKASLVRCVGKCV